MTDQDKLRHLSADNKVLVEEWLDIVANDSENLERTLKCITDNCTWVMEPGGTAYDGIEQIRAFVGIAMSGRTHDEGEHKLTITHWFTNSENFCYEYTHGAISTGKFTAGIKGKVKTGVLRYCITCHLCDGKIDRVHEYIDSTSWLLHSLLPILLRALHRRAMEKLTKGQEVRPLGITAVAILMIFFGLAEVVTGFTHNFFGVSTTLGATSAYGNAGVGALYAVAGILILSMKKRYVAIALGCLALNVVGRIALVVTGLFPTNDFRQTGAIVAGTTIVIIFAAYIGSKWKHFS